LFIGSPDEISRHLYKIYGHTVFCIGGRALRCRCLESKMKDLSSEITEIILYTLNGKRNTFGRKTVPSFLVPNNYYEATDTKNVPGIDFLSSQGIVIWSHILAQNMKQQIPKMFQVLTSLFLMALFFGERGTEIHICSLFLCVAEPCLLLGRHVVFVGHFLFCC
jgi:hypothetical protein